MDLGMALAAGLGNAMTKGADGMAQERKEQGLLERMLAQQGAIGDRQQALLDARLAASGGRSSSGSRGRSGSGGLLDVVDAGILTPEQNRASIIGQAGTMADLERNTQIINNPNAARAGMERQVPPGEAGPPMMMDDKAWQGQVDSAVNFMRDIRTAMARSSADYKDMSGGDVQQSSIEISRGVGRGKIDPSTASDLVSLANGKPLKPVEDVTTLKAGTMTNMMSDITRQHEIAQKTIADANTILKETRGVDQEARAQAQIQRQEALAKIKQLEQTRQRLLSQGGNIGAGVSAPANRHPNDPRNR